MRPATDADHSPSEVPAAGPCGEVHHSLKPLGVALQGSPLADGPHGEGLLCVRTVLEGGCKSKSSQLLLAKDRNVKLP